MECDRLLLNFVRFILLLIVTRIAVNGSELSFFYLISGSQTQHNTILFTLEPLETECAGSKTDRSNPRETILVSRIVSLKTIEGSND